MFNLFNKEADTHNDDLLFSIVIDVTTNSINRYVKGLIPLYEQDEKEILEKVDDLRKFIKLKLSEAYYKTKSSDEEEKRMFRFLAKKRVHLCNLPMDPDLEETINKYVDDYIKHLNENDEK